jgi:hypothetical protein
MGFKKENHQEASIMKRNTSKTASVLLCITLFVFCLTFIKTTSAQSGEDILVSFQSNSGWILNKSARKLMYFQYTKHNEVWKSNAVTLPANIDLNNCILDCVGSRGNAVFLFDKTSDTIYFFQVLKDHSIMQYTSFDVKSYLK